MFITSFGEQNITYKCCSNFLIHLCFTAPLPIVLTIIGYAIALFFLGLTFKSIPMGLAYALWSGAGIILISTVGWIYFKQQLDFAAVVGLSFMIIGIVIIHMFSKSTHL